MDKRASAMGGAGWVIVMMIFFAPLSLAATEAPETADKASSAGKTSAGSSAQPGSSDMLTRLIAAGQAVVERSLASKEKGKEPVTAQTAPKKAGQKTAGGTKASKSLSDMGLDASGAKAKKYVFEYPDRPVINDEMLPVRKTIEGEVSSVIKMGMSVTFERDAATASSRDLWIDFTKGTKLEGVKSFGAFREGDIVKVSYTESKDGAKRAIDSIKLVKTLTDEERKAKALADEAATLAEEELAKKEEAMQEKP